MTRKVHPLVLAKPPGNACDTESRTLDACERGKAINVLAKIDLFGIDGEQLTLPACILPACIRFTDGNKVSLLLQNLMNQVAWYEGGKEYKVKYRDQRDLVGLSYRGQQHARGEQRTRRLGTTRCEIDGDMSSAGNQQWGRQHRPRVFEG